MTRETVAFERVNPTEGVARTFSVEDVELAYEPGAVVATPRGTGVVNGALVEDFEFPQTGAGDEVAPVEASEGTPAYVVGYGGRSAPFRADALSPGDLYNPRQANTDRSAITDPVAEHALNHDAMPDTWLRRDLLDWWAAAGGLWRRARSYLKRNQGLSDDEAVSTASQRKDMVLGTDRWRTRF